MNRGVVAYMREGNRCAKNTFKNFINNFKYYFLLLVIFFGSLCPLTLPFVTILSIRMARLAERDEDIQICKSFERVDNARTFWTVVAYNFLIGVFYLAGIVLIVLLAGIFGGIGIVIGGLTTVGFIIAGVLAAPFAILLIIYLIVFPFMFAPALYLYDCNPNLGLSGMLYNSYDAMRKTGKWTLFIMSIGYGLRHLLWLVLIGASTAVMIIFYSQQIIRIAAAVALLVFVIIYFFKFAKLTLAHSVSVVLLFNDICSSEKYISLEQSKEENTPKNVYGVSKRTLRAAKKEQLLLGLFTNGVKLTDPEGVDQTKLPNEVEEGNKVDFEEEKLFEDAPENVVEISKHEVEDKPVEKENEEYSDEEEVMDTILSSVVEEPVVEETIEEPVVEEQPVEEIADLEFSETITEEEIGNILNDILNVEDTSSEDSPVEETPVIEEVLEPVIEETPVVEKPKRGRKKATPVVEEPVSEEPVYQEEVVYEEQPIDEQAIYEEPVYQEEVVYEEQPIDEQAIYEEPVYQEIMDVDAEAVYEEPVVEEAPVVEKPKRGRKKVVKEE